MVAGVYVAVVERREDVAVPDGREVPLHLAGQRRPQTGGVQPDNWPKWMAGIRDDI